MKKCIAFALALLLALSWSACAYNYRSSMDTYGMIVITLKGNADIFVDYGGEVLSINNSQTFFGSMQVEGRSGEKKTLHLDSSNFYEVDIFGNDNGYVDYTIAFPGNGNQTDTRQIIGIPIFVGLHATTNTEQTSVITIRANGESYTAARGERRVYHETTPSISSYRGRLDVTASSYFENNNPPVYPSCVIDGDDSTSWDAWGEYENAWIQLSVTDGNKYLIKGFTIVNGKGVTNRNMDYWKKNSRVKDFSVYVDDQYAGSYTLKDNRSPQTVYLSTSVEGSNIQIQIDSVYRGSKYNDSKFGVCISEIDLW